MRRKSLFAFSPGAVVTTVGICAIGCVIWLASRGTSVVTAIVISLCSAAVLAGMLILGSGQPLDELERYLRRSPAAVLAIITALWGLYIFYALGTHSAQVRGIVAMGIYLSVPFLMLARKRGVARGTYMDVAAILWVWLPLELGMTRRFLTTSTPNADFHYAVAEGLAVNMSVVAFAAWRRLPGIGYRLKFDRNSMFVAVACFLLFAGVAIPSGFAIHFIHYSFTLRKLMLSPAVFIGVFLFIAIPEELLFRGLIQNWFQRFIDSKTLGLILPAIVFGASHLNNGPPVPNYKYFFMASIAGVFYGLVWRRTGNIAASAVTHALVDTAWTVFFR